jgi:hypothetical protein
MQRDAERVELVVGTASLEVDELGAQLTPIAKRGEKVASLVFSAGVVGIGQQMQAPRWPLGV